MWSLSLDDIQRIKEELKGRRAALRARYDDDVQTLEADLANIETLELAANLFVAKYRSEPGEDAALAELAPASAGVWDASGPAVEPHQSPNWRTLLDKRVAAEPAKGEPAKS